VARSLVGVKYRHGGRTRNSLDCGGLLIAISEELNLPKGKIPLGYSRYPNGELRAYILSGAVPQPTPSGGDIALWNSPHLDVPQHTGILTENGGIIHACLRSRKVVEITRDPSWDVLFIEAFTFMGVV